MQQARAYKFFSYLLIFQLILPTNLSLSENTELLRHDDDLLISLQNAFEDPLLAWIKKQGDQFQVEGFSLDDPALDEDPFFLKNQSWKNNLGSYKEVVYRTEHSSVTIQFSNLPFAWELNAPLQPILFTDEYVILSLKENSNLFKKVSSDEGQGLFIVSYLELLKASPKKGRDSRDFKGEASKVPVYFFPLPGKNWQSNVQAFEFSTQNTIVLVDSKGGTLPILMDDIEEVIKAERLNLAMAFGLGLKGLNKQSKKPHVLPPRCSTAGFGMLYTGLNCDHPELSQRFSFQTSKTKNKTQFISLLSLAYAEDKKDDKDDDDDGDALISRLLRVGAVLGIALIASTTLKYTVYKQKFQQEALLEDEKLKDATVLKKVSKKALREAKDVGDVFAHTLTVFNQFVSVWFANGIEFLGDRFFPRLAASENGLVRRFLRKTVYFTRQSNERTPVNSETLVKGAFIFGGIDTFFLYLQLYYIVPQMGSYVADHVPALKSRVEEAFSLDNPNVATLNQNSMVGNAAAWLSAGAMSFSKDIQGQYMNTVLPEVEAQMQKEGLDPNDPQNQKIKDQRIKERIETAMHQMGLPGPEAFLFDASTLYEATLKLLGYENKRPGLIVPSLKKALQILNVQFKQNPVDESLKNSIELLEKTLIDLKFLENFIKAPGKAFFSAVGSPVSLNAKLEIFKKSFIEHAGRFKKVRQMLMALTYEGKDSEQLKAHIPSEWLEFFGEKGSVLAAQAFRRAYFGYVLGDPFVFGPTKSQQKKYAKVVMEDAQKELLERHRDEVVLGSLNILKKKYADEFSVIVDEKIVELLRDQGAVQSYKENIYMKKKGLVVRWQERRATRKAQEAYLHEFGVAFEPEFASDPQKQRWNEIYAQAFMETLGLHPDYIGNPEHSQPELLRDVKAIETNGNATEYNELKQLVESRAKLITDKQIQSDPALSEHLQILTPTERMSLTSTLYADNAISQYIAATVYAERVAPTAPAQPGRLQRLRQTSFAKKSKILTRSCRMAEALLSDTAYRPGFGGMLDRNLPLWEDLRLATMRTLRGMFTSALGHYPFNRMVWNINLPPSLWTFHQLDAPIIIAPAQMLNRAFRMQGFKPMGKMSLLVLYGVIFSWLTFEGALPEQIFVGDFQKAWERYITQPIENMHNWLQIKLRFGKSD